MEARITTRTLGVWLYQVSTVRGIRPGVLHGWANLNREQAVRRVQLDLLDHPTFSRAVLLKDSVRMAAQEEPKD